MKKFNKNSLLSQFSLKNRIVIITGGGGFLAKYFADAVCEFGGTVILIDFNLDGLNKNIKYLRKQKYKCYSFNCDLTDSAQVDKVYKDIKKKFKIVDVLINAINFIGVTDKSIKKNNPYFESFEKYDYLLWEKSLNVNLTGTFLITQKIGHLMALNKNGSIINLASDVGIVSPDHRIYKKSRKDNYLGVDFNTPISYSVSKAGIISFTRYLATYWAANGVRVNSISPAGINNNFDKKFVMRLSNIIPLGRMAKPEELKGAIVFLASEASSFVTGSNLVVDGGRTII